MKHKFKWIMWIVVGSILVFGGLAFVISPGYSVVFKAFCRFSMFFGFIIYGTILVLFIIRHLKL
jgi:hypothetical protein